MLIEVTDAGPATIVKITGHLVIESEERLERTVDKLIADGHNRLVFDLAQVDTMDSSGLGSLVCAYSKALKAGGEAKLAHPSSRTRTLLDITKLSSVFDIYGDADSALSSFEWR